MELNCFSSSLSSMSSFSSTLLLLILFSHLLHFLLFFFFFSFLSPLSTRSPSHGSERSSPHLDRRILERCYVLTMGTSRDIKFPLHFKLCSCPHLRCHRSLAEAYATSSAYLHADIKRFPSVHHVDTCRLLFPEGERGFD